MKVCPPSVRLFYSDAAVGISIKSHTKLAAWYHYCIILTFIARPVAVFLCTIFWKYSLKEKLFICWGGIKGAVPIVLATYPYVEGLEGGSYYFNVVFFVVLLSALIQGSSIDLVAKKLSLLAGNKTPNPFSFELIALQETQSELLEYSVDKGSWLVNHSLQDIPWPQDSLVTAIVRQEEIITPRGDTVIKPKDLLFILLKNDYQEELLDLLDGTMVRMIGRDIRVNHNP